jgi:hypothetical protein
MISWSAARTFCLPDSAIVRSQFPNFFVSTSPTALRPIGRVRTDGTTMVRHPSERGEALKVILIIHICFNSFTITAIQRTIASSRSFFKFCSFDLDAYWNSVQRLKPCLMQIGLENLNQVGKSVRKNKINPISEIYYS